MNRAKCRTSKSRLRLAIRSRHPSESSPTEGVKVKKVVTLDLTEVLKRRANKEEVTVADMAVHHNKEYFPNFLRLRSELFLWLICLCHRKPSNFRNIPRHLGGFRVRN